MLKWSQRAGLGNAWSLLVSSGCQGLSVVDWLVLTSMLVSAHLPLCLKPLCITCALLRRVAASLHTGCALGSHWGGAFGVIVVDALATGFVRSVGIHVALALAPMASAAVARCHSTYQQWRYAHPANGVALHMAQATLSGLRCTHSVASAIDCPSRRSRRWVRLRPPPGFCRWRGALGEQFLGVGRSASSRLVVCCKVARPFG